MNNDLGKHIRKIVPTRTINGESGSKTNAVGSGLFARSAVIKTKYYEESEEDFKKLFEGLRSAFAPQGDYEEELVRQLAYDVHCRKRGELYENAVIGQNEEERIHQLEEELGIPALKQNIEAAEIRREACKRNVDALSRIPEDIAQAAETDFEQHRVAFQLIYDELWEHTELAAKMAMERAWKLGRVHLVLREGHVFRGPPAALYQVVLQRKTGEMQEVETELDRMYPELRAKEKELKKIMSHDCLRCLLPNKQDLEALDRFYAMCDRKIAKTFDQLAKVQFARQNGQLLIAAKRLPGNGSGKPTGSSELRPQARSAAPVSQQSTTKEGEDHAA